MIIQNGFIAAKAKKSIGIDPETGFPISPIETAYEKPIPCQYITNSHNNLGSTTNNEHFTIAQYTIFIEQQPTPFTAEQIRLYDMDKKNVGDFSVISIEPIDAVCQTKILV